MSPVLPLAPVLELGSVASFGDVSIGLVFDVDSGPAKGKSESKSSNSHIIKESRVLLQALQLVPGAP